MTQTTDTSAKLYVFDFDWVDETSGTTGVQSIYVDLVPANHIELASLLIRGDRDSTIELRTALTPTGERYVRLFRIGRIRNLRRFNEPARPSTDLNSKAVEVALYKVIESEDSDLADSIEAPEDGDPSRYPTLATLFIKTYREILGGN